MINRWMTTEQEKALASTRTRMDVEKFRYEEGSRIMQEAIAATAKDTEISKDDVINGCYDKLAQMEYDKFAHPYWYNNGEGDFDIKQDDPNIRYGN